MKKVNKSVVMLGDPRVGKTCLLIRLTKGKAELRYKETYGSDFYFHEIELFDQKVVLNIWDTCGEEDYFQIIGSSIFKDAKGIFIVCSYDDRSSLDSLHKWCDFVKCNIEDDSNIPKFVIVNKYDIPDREKKFCLQEVKDTCNKLDIQCLFETSIHKPVDTVFTRFTEHILGRALSYRKSSFLTETTRVSLSKGNPSKTQRPSTFNEITEQQEEIDLTSPMECNSNDKIQKCLIPKLNSDVKSQATEIPKKKKSKCCF
jgi:small GTP-binding protein